MNIKGAIIAAELMIMTPTKKVFERITHWLHLGCTPVDAIEGYILLLTGCDTPEAGRDLEQGLVGRKTPSRVTLLGRVILGPSTQAAGEARPVICVSTGDVRITEQLSWMCEMDLVDVQSLDNVYSVENVRGVALVQ